MQSPARGRTAALWAIKIAISAGLLGLLFSRIDLATLWAEARDASPGWLSVALGVYLSMVLLSAWRWGLLLRAVGVPMRAARVLTSVLVAVFFNNFLPSNIGGDVVRIADSAKPAGSKTIAALIVLADRVLGLLGLLAVAALGASFALELPGTGSVGPSILWTILGLSLLAAGWLVAHPSLMVTLLGPIRRLHPEWIGERLERLADLLASLRGSPGVIAAGVFISLTVQGLLVAFYLAIAYALAIPVAYWQLALIVPMTFLVQMVPVSLNGFGVREASFAYYFTRIGLSIEQALLMSFVGAALTAAFSLSGAAAYVARRPSAQPSEA